MCLLQLLTVTSNKRIPLVGLIFFLKSTPGCVSLAAMESILAKWEEAGVPGSGEEARLVHRVVFGEGTIIYSYKI